MKLIRLLASASTFVMVTALATTNAFAQNSDKAITASLSQKLNLDIISIADSPVPGLKQVFTNRGLFYVSDNGEFFLQARVYNITQGVEDETENALKSVRLEGVERFKDSAIEFKADKEKYVINVFTDTTCGYCRKLHNEMDQLNDLGITVRYLAWPRAGINSKVYDDTVSIWCSQDPHQAITDAKAGKPVNDAKCKNQVAEQFKFGQQIGVSGTPNIIMPDGSVVPGYQPAQALALALKDLS
ncbi:thiol:disulfide interchange protein DsbC [Glaciecola punicea ACAM 611]|jgi:thiol:disulfide interchange protein DsbC|uniref:Thiol:disulfide interchange protein n=1 Tax=Glaciecola punicea ACAM 611 TaxID=1121923 RepID=H5TDC1_9ALTE|nr:bifunctional protein-disulfide isomerase/oxidoreductase DsbC [Glaciecola punicea]GAB56298.1 thiol:disulfide interchange protein DsbC [Glaciecola punicea ACAM 611]